MMIFSNTEIEGVYLINIEKFEDERGFFGRSWDDSIFKEKNLNPKLVQCSISYNKQKGTIRGMHYQESPYGETKLVRCTKGSIYDVVVDLRKNSKTYKKWFGVILDSNKHTQLYIPEGIAHGFQTLEDNSDVFYQISEYHHPEHYNAVRWNDPMFNIDWPLQVSCISKKDANVNDFKL